jgi:hypothetical protein
MTSRLATTAACGLALVFCACTQKKQEKAPTTQPLSSQTRHDRALHDPFGYKPDFSGTGVTDNADPGALDKEGLRRDLDHVFFK